MVHDPPPVRNRMIPVANGQPTLCQTEDGWARQAQTSPTMHFLSSCHSTLLREADDAEADSSSTHETPVAGKAAGAWIPSRWKWSSCHGSFRCGSLVTWTVFSLALRSTPLAPVARLIVVRPQHSVSSCQDTRLASRAMRTRGVRGKLLSAVAEQVAHTACLATLVPGIQKAVYEVSCRPGRGRRRKPITMSGYPCLPRPRSHGYGLGLWVQSLQTTVPDRTPWLSSKCLRRLLSDPSTNSISRESSARHGVPVCTVRCTVCADESSLS